MNCSMMVPISLINHNVCIIIVRTLTSKTKFVNFTTSPVQLVIEINVSNIFRENENDQANDRKSRAIRE